MLIYSYWKINRCKLSLGCTSQSGTLYFKFWCAVILLKIINWRCLVWWQQVASDDLTQCRELCVNILLATNQFIYYNFVMLVRVCVSNFVRLQRLLRWYYQEFDNFQCSGVDVVIKNHFISSSSCRRDLWLYHIRFFSKKNVPSC